MIQYRTLNCNGKLISLERPAVMGIINVNMDSFYSASRVMNETGVLKRIAQMQENGAVLIDIGAMSSRPGADIIPKEEEWDRLFPIISLIRTQFPGLILSVDTVHSTSAEKVLDIGVDIINDISGGMHDHSMMEVVGRFRAPFIIMHMKGMPENMQINPEYDDVVTEVFDFFVSRISVAEQMGIVDLILDPGFGFGKTVEHNYQLLQNLHAFEILRYPIMTGVSRKGMIQKLLEVNAENALNGTTAVHMLALMNGTRILRVHDVKEAMECIKIWEKFNKPDADISDWPSYIIR